MKLATRINSFLPMYDNDLDQVFGALRECGLKYVNLNYPEHVEAYTPKDVKDMLDKHGLKLNAVNMRFRKGYEAGEFTNVDPEVNKKAVQLCKDGADFCREVGGTTVVVWLGFAGFDYPFQANYVRAWDNLVASFKEICNYAKDMKFAIEYKPYEERAYTFIDSFGITGMIINEVGCDNLGISVDFCHMLMKRENPAYAVEYFGRKNKIFAVDFNDGYGLLDDGLMIGTSSPFQVLEFLYYVKKYSYSGVIYFDTFPVVEHPVRECKENIKMIRMYDELIEEVGMDYIQEIIDQRDGTKVTKLLRRFFGKED